MTANESENQPQKTGSPDGPQKKDEQSRQMGMREAEQAEDVIAADKVTGSGIDELVPEANEPDRGIFRDERAGNPVKTNDDDRTPNLPGYAHEDVDDPATNALDKHTRKPKGDPELLEDAYSKNDPGVETKE